MAADPKLVQALREAAREAGAEGLEEKRMFGGMCFMWRGHLLCGVQGPKTGGGTMYRVGREREAEAFALGARRLSAGTRAMAGYASLPPDAEGTEALIRLAVACVAALPAR